MRLKSVRNITVFSISYTYFLNYLTNVSTLFNNVFRY